MPSMQNLIVNLKTGTKKNMSITKDNKTKTTKKKRKEIRFDELIDLLRYDIIKKEDASAIALRILNRLENETDTKVLVFDIVRLIDKEILTAEQIREFYKDTIFT